MEKEKFYSDSITIRGKEIPVKIEFLPVNDLKFYPENPRIHSMIGEFGQEITQEEIYEKLINMEHVRELIRSIKVNKGLREPLIVRNNLVLEGNSRLAAYKELAGRDLTWSTVKCKILPENIGDDIAFALLADHISGKKDWAPYEQAGYLYRRHKQHGVSTKQIADDMGLTKGYVDFYIEVYDFMIKHKETDINRWSYYFEYLKSRKIRKARNKYPELDKIIVKKIKDHDIAKAADLRDKLPIILRAKSVTVNKFLDGSKNFEDSYHSACDQGQNKSCYIRLNKFRTWVVEPETEDDIISSDKNVRDKCKFELTKINNRAEKLIGKLDKLS